MSPKDPTDAPTPHKLLYRLVWKDIGEGMKQCQMCLGIQNHTQECRSAELFQAMNASVRADAAASRAPSDSTCDRHGDKRYTALCCPSCEKEGELEIVRLREVERLAAGARAVPSAHGRPSNDALKSAAAQLRLGNHRAMGNDTWEGNCIDVSTWLRLMADEPACAVPETTNNTLTETCAPCGLSPATGDPK